MRRRDQSCRRTSCSCCAPRRACTSPCDGRSLGRTSWQPRDGRREPDELRDGRSPTPRPPSAARRAWRARSSASASAIRERCRVARGGARDARRRRVDGATTTVAGAAGHAVAALRQRHRRARRPTATTRSGCAATALPPAPWSNVIANPRGGFVVTERGGGLHLGGEQLLLPPHAVAQRSGERSGRARCSTCGTRRRGELWSATPAPIRERRAVHRPPRRRASRRSSTSTRGIATRAHARHGATDDAGQALAAAADQPRATRPRRLTLTAYVEWTLGVLREHTQHQVRTAFDARAGAIFARNTFDPQFAELARVPRDERAGDELHGRPARVPRPQRHRRRSGGAAPAAPLAGTTGAGIDPCAALQCALELAAGETREIVVAARRRARATARRAQLIAERIATSAHAQAAHRRRPSSAWARAARRSITRAARRSRRSTRCSTAGRSTRRSPAGCGRARRSTRAAARTASATSCRTSWRSCTPSRRSRASTSCAPPRASSSRATCSTGGTRTAGAACARASRTTSPGCPYVVDHYVRVTGDAHGARRVRAVPRRCARSSPDEHEVYDLPQRHRRDGERVRALPARAAARVHHRRARPAADRHRRLERRHEPGRRRGTGESVWLAWFLIDHAAALRRRMRRAGTTWRGGRAARAGRRVRDGGRGARRGTAQWYRRAYFDDGTPLGSARERRVPDRLDRAELERHLRRRRARRGRRRRCASLEEHLVREDARLLMLLTPPFDKTPHDPATSRATCRACGRTARSTRTPRSGRCWRPRCSGDGDRAFELFQMINPLTHARTPEEVADATRSSRTWWRPTCTRRRGQLGRGGWTWYTGSASWMYRVGLEAILGFTKRGDTLTIRPCVPRGWPEYRDRLPVRGQPYHIAVDRWTRRPATPPRSRWTADGSTAAMIPLVDDGATHEVRVRIRRA